MKFKQVLESGKMMGKDETAKDDKKTEKSSNVWVTILMLMGCIGVFAIFIWLLSTHLGSPNSDNDIAVFSYTKSDLGTLGDLLGGVLNPILSFITICLLIWSIQIQIDELRETRKEIERSSTALENANTMHYQNLKAQDRNLASQILMPKISATISLIYKEFNKEDTIVEEYDIDCAAEPEPIVVIYTYLQISKEDKDGESLTNTEKILTSQSIIEDFRKRLLRLLTLIKDITSCFSAMNTLGSEKILFQDEYRQVALIVKVLIDVADKINLIELKDQFEDTLNILNDLESVDLFSAYSARNGGSEPPFDIILNSTPQT